MSKMLRFSSMEALNAVRKTKAPAPAPSPMSRPAVQAAPTVGAKARLQALGRKKPGEMNKTEQRFVDEWIAPRVRAGEIVWWAFEAVTLKLAPDCRLTIDFFIMRSDGRLEAIDTKGSFAIATDDFLVKVRVAASMFPWKFSMIAPRAKKLGGGWEEREF